MSANTSMKYGVILVISEMIETSTSLLRSSQIAKIASSLNVFMYSSMSSFDISTNLFILKWETPISSERTDFSRHSARFEPMPITSPVAFICVPSSFDALANLSNGNLGSFATT